MPGLRELLAVVLGVLLGIGLLAAPRTALRLSVIVSPTRRRRGDYGTDDAIPGQWAPEVTSGFVAEVEPEYLLETDESFLEALVRLLSGGFGDAANHDR